jgi:hypothetical protein
MGHPMTKQLSASLLIAVAALAASCTGIDRSSAVFHPGPHLHSHNDYERAQPLMEAQRELFCSVEADVWLTDGKLLVAHEQKEIRPDRTLQSLYLEPLAAQLRTKRPEWRKAKGDFFLMIDIKSSALPTYHAVEEALEPYREILTTWKEGKRRNGYVTVVLSGNRPIEHVLRQKSRLVALDGRLQNLHSNAPSREFLWISDSYQKYDPQRSGWSESIAARIRQDAKAATDQGRIFRIWAAPDNPDSWRRQVEAGVTMINTDRPGEARRAIWEPK